MNNTQSIKSSTTFYLYLYLSPLFFFFLVLRLFFLLQGGEPRGPRGDQVDLGQPIAATRPDGVPPGRVGFRVQKRRLAVLRIALEVGLPRCELRSISLGAAGTHRRVRVTRSSVNTLFSDSAGDEALNGLRPVLATKRSSSRVFTLRR